MFKVLVVAYYFPPMGLSGVQRTLKFVKYMKQFGWEPTVITTDKTAYFAHDGSMAKEVEANDIRVIRTGSSDPYSLMAKKGTIKMPAEWVRSALSKLSKTFFIPDNKISWANKAVKVAKELLENEDFDAIYVTIPPFSAFEKIAELKEKYDVPLFVDYRDLWYGNHFAFYPTPYHKVKHKKLEYKSLKNADRVIVVNRKIKESLLQKYPFLSFDDVTIIPHGYDPADFEGKSSTLPANNKLKIVYSGIFYDSITPEYMFRAFKELLVERPDIASNIQIHIAGMLRKENANMVNKLGLSEYVFNHGYMDHSEVAGKLLGADILWVMLGRNKNIDTVTPGKLLEYFGTKKPVLATVPKGISEIVCKEYKASFICEPDDIDAIKSKLIEIYTLFQKNELPIPDEEFVDGYNRVILTEQLTKQFQFFLKD
ncbi:MAG: glycosyl transferase family 1 [Melioribacteraceae bacterium]|nr:MAG: glycosyl transferase family 1 [Melioribacteraceae bacterium]